VALKHKHKACAALLDPSSAAPLVWPSPLKFISELSQEAKALLENALLEANREREKAILKEVDMPPSPLHSESEDSNMASEVQHLPFLTAVGFRLVVLLQCIFQFRMVKDYALVEVPRVFFRTQ